MTCKLIGKSVKYVQTKATKVNCLIEQKYYKKLYIIHRKYLRYHDITLDIQDPLSQTKWLCEMCSFAFL